MVRQSYRPPWETLPEQTIMEQQAELREVADEDR